MLDFELTPEQIALQKRAREFALKELLPAAWEYDQRYELPIHVLDKAYAAGLINADIPKAYGGPGLGLLEGVLATEELAAVCPGLATSIFDNSLGMEPILLCDNEALKQRILPEIHRERKFICFATSEPTMGSDVSGMKCKATPDGDDFILNGTKYWITNAGIADYMTVFATVDPKSLHEGICAFLVERDWEGVATGRHIPKLG